MQITNIITQDGIFEEMDRICGSSYVEYPYRDKASRINASLDWYFQLAFKSGKNQNFDDINETSAPIDTQNIVSGTNSYKLGSFTETVLSYLRFEALDSAGVGLRLIPETMEDIEKAGDTFQERYTNAPSGTPTHYIKYGDFIYLRPNPNYSETSGLLAYFERPLTKMQFLRYTVSQEASATFTTASAHGMLANDTVIFSTNGTIPTGITANTIYYIKTAATTVTFTVAPTLAGTAVTITDDQDGSVQMCLHASQSPGIPIVHHPALARHASLAWLIDKSKPQAGAIAQLSQQDERDITKFFSERNKDIKPQMLPNVEDCR